MCEQFIELMDYKRQQNLMALSGTSDLQALMDEMRADIDYDLHCAVGLGKRMPIPEQL